MSGGQPEARPSSLSFVCAFHTPHSRRHFTRTEEEVHQRPTLPHHDDHDTILIPQAWVPRLLLIGWSSQDRRRFSSPPLLQQLRHRSSSSSSHTHARDSRPTSSPRPRPRPLLPPLPPLRLLRSMMRSTSCRVLRVRERQGAGSWVDQEGKGTGRGMSKERVPRRVVLQVIKDG